jgi:hypothetical protein
VSLRGFTANLLLYSLILGAVNPGFLGNADWLCPSRSEMLESNVEEVAQVVLSAPHASKSGARRECLRFLLPVHVHRAPANSVRLANERTQAAFLHLEANPMRC